MNEFISDFKQWVSDMADNPELIGSELANVGGKIFRGVAAVAGGTVEAVGSVGAAAVDITASALGAESVGEEAAKAIKKPFEKVSDGIQGAAAAVTCVVSKAAGDVGGEMESEVEIDVHGSKALKKAFGRSIPLVRGCVLTSPVRIFRLRIFLILPSSTSCVPFVCEIPSACMVIELIG